MANKNLNAAKAAKMDEFYTQLSDIERELQHYWPHFAGKVVLCNCDDPYESNFFKYFALRFNQLGLKKLICTCYNGSPIMGKELSLFALDSEGDEKKVAYKVEISEVSDVNGDGAIDLADVEYLIKNEKNVLSSLKGNDGHTVGVGEHRFDFILIADALGCSAFYGNNWPLQSLGKFGLISGAGNL